jgi:hypothetical protein
MKRLGSAAVLAIATLATLGPAGPLYAGRDVPFKGHLVGSLVSRTPLTPPLVLDDFELEGNATHLGRFELVIEAVVDFGTLPPTAFGTYTFVASNGDELVADFTGASSPVVPGTVLITEHAVIDPDQSTGRFAGATGEFVVQRLADAATGVDGVTIGSFEGTISRPGS